jgi:hypothetical protein
MENSIDGYHGLPTHKRWFDVLKAAGVHIAGRVGAVRTRVEDLGHGHAITFAPPPALDPTDRETATAEEFRRSTRRARLGPERAAELDVARAC